VISEETVLLIDAARDFAARAERWVRIDAILVTHGHRDAIGGLASLRRRWLGHNRSQPINIFLGGPTGQIIHTRNKRFDHCRLHVGELAQPRRVGSFVVSALVVPHARELRFTTFAWRGSAGARSVVYASDVAFLTPELREFSAGATVLVLDGARRHKRLFSHLTLDDALPQPAPGQ